LRLRQKSGEAEGLCASPEAPPRAETTQNKSHTGIGSTLQSTDRKNMAMA